MTLQRVAPLSLAHPAWLVACSLLPACPPDVGTTTLETGTTLADTSGTGPHATTGDPTTTSAPNTTGDTSTGPITATTGDTSTGPITATTGDTSTGDTTISTTTLDTSTGDTAISTTSLDTSISTTSLDTSTGDIDTSTGDAPDPLCCEAGCSRPLLQSATGNVRVHHGGATIATHDAKNNLVLWSAADHTAILRAVNVTKVQLVGGTLAYEQAGEIHLVAGDGSTLGVCDADQGWGLARDESYLWTSGPAGLRVHETDCSVRWSVAGSLGDAKVLATAAAVHAFDADLGPQSVTHFAATDGAAEVVPFAGTAFGGWFADVPRYWTLQGQAYRIFDLDGAPLFLSMGAPQHGWGTRMVLGSAVVDISAPDVALATLDSERAYSGPAILTYDDEPEKTRVIRLDQDPITVTEVAKTCCVDKIQSWTFAYAAGEWAVGGRDGVSADQDGALVSPGDILGLAGSPVARVAAAVASATVRVFDVDDDCGVTEHPPFPRKGARLWMSADGQRLLSEERWIEGLGSNRFGTRHYALPGGQLLAGHQLGIMSDNIRDHDVADDGSLWSRTWSNTGINHYNAYAFPATALFSGDGNMLPKIAPDALHVVETDGIAFDGNGTLVGGQSYVYEPDDFINVFEGITHGFIDDERLLVAHYGPPSETFLGAEIVDLDGLVLQPADLPEIRRFVRLGTGEILAIVHTTGDAAIFDPLTGEQLWAGPHGYQVVLAGVDQVVVGDASRLELVRWR